MTPTISVLMPVYNAERYIAEAVMSILEQSFRDFEFIIINDGSTDRSLAIIEDFAKADTRIRIISRPNTGIVIALNQMIELAQGEFVARMDADDISLSDRFSKQLAKLQSKKSLVAIGTDVMLVDPENRDLVAMSLPLDGKAIDEQNLAGIGLAICHPSVMMRTEALRRVNCYRSEFWPAEDVDLFLRLAEIGEIENLPTVGVRYRMHAASTGYTCRHLQVSAARKAATDAYNRRGLKVPSSLMINVVEIKGDHHIIWAWWALKGRNLTTARRYAIRAFLRNPFQRKTITLLCCAVRGY